MPWYEAEGAEKVRAEVTPAASGGDFTAGTTPSEVDDFDSGSYGTAKWMKFGDEDNNKVVLAYGDGSKPFPQIMFLSDPGNAFVTWGDGSADPNDSPSGGYMILGAPDAGGDFEVVAGTNSIKLNPLGASIFLQPLGGSGVWLRDGSGNTLFHIMQDGSLILRSTADSSLHKLVVGADGALSTVAFP